MASHELATFFNAYFERKHTFASENRFNIEKSTTYIHHHSELQRLELNR